MASRTLDQFVRNLRKGVNRTYSKKTMRLAGELAILQIVQRTRAGKGVSKTGAKEKKLLPLSDPYKEYRRRNRRQLDRTTTPNKSNLTFTGRLLRSMVIKKLTNRSVEWGPKNNKRRGENLTNERLGEIVADAGRPFNNLGKEDLDRIGKLIDKILQREMRRL